LLKNPTDLHQNHGTNSLRASQELALSHPFCLNNTDRQIVSKTSF
jgi:hypothetical protein